MEIKWYFWYSEKMKKMCLALGKYSGTFIVLNNKKVEYTEMRDQPTPCNRWDDNVYLGELVDSDYWKVFSVCVEEE